MNRTGMILVLNCGSSSIKFALFDVQTMPPARTPAWSGRIEAITGKMPLWVEQGREPVAIGLDPQRPYAAAVAEIRRRVVEHLAGSAHEGSAPGELLGVVHRVVHGGARYFEPVRLDADVLANLRAYIPLAPLHQPHALEAIEILLRTVPGLPQVACFDTAFHHTTPKIEQLLPLPWGSWDRGLRRYGFHGLSYAYMARALPERHGELARGRCIVAHLGSGASLCAMSDLQSVATTMGFSALEGLVMGTRCGSIDPGAVLYLMEIEKLSLEEVGRLLYYQSGLLGVSGISSDPRVLLEREADDERASLALQLYVRRIVREIGALVAVLGGLDLLVFTAGVGENNVTLRDRICMALGYLCVKIDARANATNAPVISTADSAVRVGVEPTNEEWMAALDAAPLLGLG